MKKILVIGCPGSGKSTFSRKLQKKLGYDLLHLDFIYHIDNNHQISKQELRQKIKEFTKGKDTFIIDGNYTGTLEYRMQFADTIFFLEMDKDVCLKNVVKRQGEPKRSDMAVGFDHTKMDDDFLEFIETFNDKKTPQIEDILSRFEGEVIRIKNYLEMKQYV